MSDKNTCGACPGFTRFEKRGKFRPPVIFDGWCSNLSGTHSVYADDPVCETRRRELEALERVKSLLAYLDKVMLVLKAYEQEVGSIDDATMLIHEYDKVKAEKEIEVSDE